MRPETKETIKRILIEFVRTTLPLEIDLDVLKKAYPFHALFFTDEGLRGFKIQRRLVTKMGQKLIPMIAEIIAKEKYGSNRVMREHKIEGMVDQGMMLKIDEIIEKLSRKKKTVSYTHLTLPTTERV